MGHLGPSFESCLLFLSENNKLIRDPPRAENVLHFLTNLFVYKCICQTFLIYANILSHIIYDLLTSHSFASFPTTPVSVS